MKQGRMYSIYSVNVWSFIKVPYVVNELSSLKLNWIKGNIWKNKQGNVMDLTFCNTSHCVLSLIFFNNFPHKEFELWATLMLSYAENDKTDNDDDAVAKLRLFFQTKLTNKEFT